MTIRPYAPADETAVLAVWEECAMRGWADPRKEIARKLKVNPEWFLVGDRDGRVMATCMIGYEGHRGWINFLAVAPEYQRSGYGRALMMAAEKILHEAGAAKINLQVRTKNASVIAFYERLGFVVDDVVNLGKRLTRD